MLENDHRYPGLEFHNSIVDPSTMVTNSSHVESLKKCTLFQYLLKSAAVGTKINGAEALSACVELSRVRPSIGPLYWNAQAGMYFPVSENIFQSEREGERIPRCGILKQIIRGTF